MEFWHLIISQMCFFNHAIELVLYLNIFNVEKSVGGHVKKFITLSFFNRIKFYLPVSRRAF